MAYNLTDDEVREFWDRYASGETAAMLARRFGKGTPATNERIRRQRRLAGTTASPRRERVVAVHE